MNTDTSTIAPDYYLIKIDERRYWNGDLILQNTKANYGVYAFDRNEQTNCCELTPSYCLTFIANDYEEVDDLDEELRGRLCEAVMDAYDERVMYMHVSDIERCLKANPKLARQVTVDTDEDDDTDPFDRIAELWGTGAEMF